MKRECPTGTERTIAPQRVQLEGWRQWWPGSNDKNLLIGKRKTDLTLTGLLMEGLIQEESYGEVGPLDDSLLSDAEQFGKFPSVMGEFNIKKQY
jgi:hypothetical protein